jgi:hypothetical protein
MTQTPETNKTVIRSVRMTPWMFGMIRDEAKRLRITFSSYLRNCAIGSIRRANTER